jgi:hypothetical protein
MGTEQERYQDILVREWKKDFDPDATALPAIRARVMIAVAKKELLGAKIPAQYAKFLPTVVTILDGLYAEIDELDSASLVLPKPSPLAEDITLSRSIPGRLPKGTK